MSVTGTIYQITDVQSVPYLGINDIYNVYYYEVIVAGTTPEEMIGGFIASMITPLCGMQCESLAHTEIRAQAITNLIDFDTFSWAVGVRPAGVRVGEILPVQDAVSFTLKRATRAVHDGSKRIGGICEADSSSGRIENVPFITAIDSVRAAMGGFMTLDSVDIARPVIVKRIQKPNPKFGVTSRASKYLYDLPDSIGTAVVSGVRSVTVDLFISHQDSRRA